MDWFSSNWPVLIVALAVILVVLGLVRRLVRLAFISAAIGVLALVVWPMVQS